MKRLVFLLILITLLVHVVDAAKKRKRKKKKGSYAKERIQKNLWEEGGYVYGTPSPVLTDPDFREFYENHLDSFKNGTKINNAFWGDDDNFLDELAKIGKYQILYYMNFYSSGIDSSTILVAAPTGVSSNPPLIDPCDIEQCIYGITMEPMLSLADISPDGDLVTPLVDEIQDNFLNSWHSSSSVMTFKDYKVIRK